MSLALKQSKAKVGANSGGAFMSRSQFQGDPGLFGFLGKAAGFLGKTVLGAAGINVGGGGSKVSQVMTPPIQRAPTALPRPMFQEVVPKPGIRGALERFVPGGATGLMVEQGTQLACPSGFHPNKSSYFLKDGTFVPEGSKCVKNRRKNPLNPRAASRAISRLESAKKATKRLDRVSIKCKRCGRARCSC